MIKFADAIRGLLGLETLAAREEQIPAQDDRSRESATEHTRVETERRKTPLELDDKLANAMELAHDEMIEDAWEWWGTRGEAEEIDTHDGYEQQAELERRSFAEAMRDGPSTTQEPQQDTKRENDEIER